MSGHNKEVVFLKRGAVGEWILVCPINVLTINIVFLMEIYGGILIKPCEKFDCFSAFDFYTMYISTFFAATSVVYGNMPE